MSILKSILCKIATFAGPRQFITFCSTIRTQLHVRTKYQAGTKIKCSLSFSEGRTNFSLANTVKAAIRLFLCDERYFLKSSRLAREPRRRAKFLMFCGFLRTTIYALLSGVNNNQPPFSLSLPPLWWKAVNSITDISLPPFPELNPRALSSITSGWFVSVTSATDHQFSPLPLPLLSL